MPPLRKPQGGLWHLGSRPRLEHTHNPWLLNMFSGDKKASYKIILMALAGLAKELCTATAPLAKFSLFCGSLEPLCHSWEKGTPDLRPPVQLTPGRTDTRSLQSAWLWVWSARREMEDNVLSLPRFARWEPGCGMAVSPGLGHARTWGCQGPGLSKAPGGKTELLCGLLSTPQAMDCRGSGFFSFPRTPGSSFWQGKRAGALCSIWKAAETDYPAAPRTPVSFLLCPPHPDLLNCQPH